MGADIKTLRNRIKSVTSTLHLTKAMGLVASSKIRRASEAMMKGRQYEAAFRNAVEMLCDSSECERSPFMQKRDGGKTRLIVIAGDRGLAGGYNANVFRLVKELCTQYADTEIIPIGKRAFDKYHGERLYYAESFTCENATAVSTELCESFAKGEFDRLGIVCTKYVSMMTQEAQVKWVLPLERSEKSKEARSILFEPDEITVLNSVIPEYVSGILAGSVRESFASEVASRRCAMDSAGKNAQEMIDNLSLAYNRARQGAITQEITEIVAGSGD